MALVSAQGRFRQGRCWLRELRWFTGTALVYGNCAGLRELRWFTGTALVYGNCAIRGTPVESCQPRDRFSAQMAWAEAPRARLSIVHIPSTRPVRSSTA